MVYKDSFGEWLKKKKEKKCTVDTGDNVAAAKRRSNLI